MDLKLLVYNKSGQRITRSIIPAFWVTIHIKFEYALSEMWPQGWCLINLITWNALIKKGHNLIEIHIKTIQLWTYAPITVLIKLMKGKALRKHTSLREKTAASVLLKLIE